MVFSSLTFLFVYFPIVLLVMKISPIKLRNFFLLLLSLIFYGWQEPVYIFIMIFSTVFDYFNGYMVYKYKDNRKVAFRFVLLSIIGNLLVLGFFKYFDFIIYNLQNIGFTSLKPLYIALPVGISFYTFQTMSYPIDVYMNNATLQKNVISFATYVAMFPQLVAGPIVRYKDIASQLDSRILSQDKFADGVFRFVIGLGKKVLFANMIGKVFDEILLLESNLTVALAWIGMIAYALQIYFDFSGYSDMAIGIGKMLGFDFLENFNYPYISTSITEFWRRWHISLGNWFKDYVYIPLGGNRFGIVRQILNIMVVWFLTGLWHGAAYNFILWGLYFGFLLILEKLFLSHFLKHLPKIVQHIYALFFILIGWAIFAIEDFGRMIFYLRSMFYLNKLPVINDLTIYYLRNNGVVFMILLLASTPLFKFLYLKYIKNRKVEWIMPFAMLLVFLLATASLVNASYNPFLYFRF
ncbi:MBOAT family protein [Erysipelotrichaceae bacterium OH741_COT-311]|nr:MBOAT family protein [Erysipelotrichaceae bacterium OH741_COT-311]